MGMNETVCVVYRTGGTENFQWKRACVGTKKDAEEGLKSIRNMGYRAFLANYKRSLLIGLPETFEPGDPIVDNAPDMDAINEQENRRDAYKAALEDH